MTKETKKPDEEKVTLFNAGQRVIEHRGYFFKPNTSASLPKSAAEYLKNLYPEEIRTQADAQEAFLKPDAAALDTPAAKEEKSPKQNAADPTDAEHDAAMKNSEAYKKAFDESKSAGFTDAEAKEMARGAK